MESKEQCEATKLSDIIKETHRSLRVQCKDANCDSVWSSHVSDSVKLHLYSQAMHSLATLHWQEAVKNKKTSCRINWIHSAILEYEKEIKIKSREKEERKLQYFIDRKILPLTAVQENTTLIPSGSPLAVLDVGSCYNPFKDYKDFTVKAIDLAPATEDVLRCDFLSVPITTSDSVIRDGAVDSLRSGSFDCVVFCLLLEYLPTPHLRLECCQKAYELLATEGVLVIVTPDSKHNGCNTLLYQLWKATLSSIGFTRVKYEKEEHFHGMLFRKSRSKELSLKSSEEMFEEIRRKLTKASEGKCSKRKVRLKAIDIEKAKSGLMIPQDLPAVKEEKTTKRKIEEIS